MWSYIKKAINSDFLNEPLDTKIDNAQSSIEGKVDTIDGIVDNIYDEVSTNASPIKGTAATSSATYVTALSVSGKGKLLRAAIQCNDNFGGYFKVTIDGVVIFTNQDGNGSTLFYPSVFNPTAISTEVPLNISFNETLLIEHKKDVTADVNTYWIYELN
jgi:hypothetical protein